jgi:hypothetical protein
VNVYEVYGNVEWFWRFSMWPEAPSAVSQLSLRPSVRAHVHLSWQRCARGWVPTHRLSLTSNRLDRFRIRAQRFLLTYSQIPNDFDREGLGDFIKQTIEEFDCITCALEEHPITGGFHIHCYIDAGRTYIVNDPRHFDFCDIHLNIKAI